MTRRVTGDAAVQWLACSTTGREVVGSSPSAGRRQSRSNRGPVALCTLGLGLLSPPSSRGRLMSTSYGWEGIRHICAMLLGARHVNLSASEVAVSTMGRYNKCSTFIFTFYLAPELRTDRMMNWRDRQTQK